ncbi:MAG: elongation factor G [Planctomycetes bacterium]|nr:elongation factor G [Planctomycetota bacterium]MCB9900140.1 elongation factor G [Planctomycetota bacterium]
MAHQPDDVRDVVLIGAGGSGKTTLAEALLFKTKTITRRGSVAEHNTVTDWDDEEKERQHSFLASAVHMPWKDHRINLIDTPGALDFLGEAICGMAACETAFLCVNAHDGVGVAARRQFRAARDQGLAVVVVITRADTDNVDGEGLHLAIQTTLGERAVPLNLPDKFGTGISAVHDVFSDDLPEHLHDLAESYRQQAIDRVVECDDELLERYFATGKVSKEELAEAFPRALRQGNIVPILHVAVDHDVGLQKLLDFLVADCPSPHLRRGTVLRKAEKGGEIVEVPMDGPFSAQVWKLHVDPHIGKVAHLRVWTGRLPSKSHFVVARTGATERIGDLQEVQGKDMKPIASAGPGDLVAVPKVDDIRVGDTVHDGHADWQFVPIPTPYPKVTLAVVPKNRNDEARLGPELAKLADADPTFIAEREKGTGEMVVRGLSPLHLDVVLRRLARKKVEALTHAPRIPYLETVTTRGEAMFRHKKQSGGRGQFAEVHLRVSPKTRGEGFEFVDEVVGGSIPRQFIPAVEKGIVEQCEKGVLAGYPFVDVAATVHFGKFHDVDSDEFSFKLASRQAFRLAVRNARPALLEPILKVDIEVPARFLGDISGDLNSRRGRIMTMNQEGDLAHIEAQVPLSEMTQYSTELRSITAGEGDYSFVFDHYDVVPPHLAEAIMASAQKDAEED